MVKVIVLTRSKVSSRGSGFSVRVSLLTSLVKFVFDFEASKTTHITSKIFVA